MLAAEALWIGGLRSTGTAHPWKAMKGQHRTPRAASLVREALVAFDDDTRLAAERVAKAERERKAELKLPAGQVVWREGASYVVGEDGELVEVVR